MERARNSVTDELGETLAHLQKRLARFFELDRDRLDDYYTDLLKDAQRRLQKADDDRRPRYGSQNRGNYCRACDVKLADAEQKYHLRIQLELLNLALVSPAQIGSDRRNSQTNNFCAPHRHMEPTAAHRRAVGL